MYDVLLWSFRAAAMGRVPSQRHDLRPFDESDRKRMLMRGQPLAKRAMVRQLKADWDGLANYFGLPSWASTSVFV